MNTNLNCRLGCPDIENLQHILHCQYLLSNISENIKISVDKVKFEYIFRNIIQQKKIAQGYIDLLHLREEIMESEVC